MQPPNEAMNVHPDELDPPFEVLEPAELRGPVAFNSPHSGCIYPKAFLAGVRLDLATLRRSEDCFVDELLLGVVERGHPLMRAHFPRCYRRRQPGTLRARSAHVRGPAAVLRQHPLDAGRRRPRHGRPRGRRRPGDLRPAHSGRRRAAADRGALQALSPAAPPADDQGSPRVRGCGAGRLPFHAVDRRPQGRAAARRHRDRRPLRHELRRHRRRGDRARFCATAAIW